MLEGFGRGIRRAYLLYESSIDPTLLRALRVDLLFLCKKRHRNPVRGYTF